VPRKGKQAAGAKGGKTGGGCQGRENKRRVPSAGKQAAGAKGGKTNNGYQGRENKQRVPRTGKQETDVKYEKRPLPKIAISL